MTKSKLVKTDSFKVLCENLTNYLEECFKESKQNKTRELLLSLEQPIKKGLELGFSFTKMAKLITDSPFSMESKICITAKQLREFCEQEFNIVSVQKDKNEIQIEENKSPVSDNKETNIVPD